MYCFYFRLGTKKVATPCPDINVPFTQTKPGKVETSDSLLSDEVKGLYVGEFLLHFYL